MIARILAVLVASAATISAAPVPKELTADGHPFKNAKVGDYTEYKMNLSIAGGATEGKLKVVVTAVTEKEVTIQSTASLGGAEQPAQESKIDLTQPFDFLSISKEPRPKTEKLSDGTESLKVGDKTYDCTWTTYKMSQEQGQGVPGQDWEAQIWMAKGVPLPVKISMTLKNPVAATMVMEFAESGNKK